MWWSEQKGKKDSKLVAVMMDKVSAAVAEQPREQTRPEMSEETRRFLEEKETANRAPPFAGEDDSEQPPSETEQAEEQISSPSIGPGTEEARGRAGGCKRRRQGGAGG